MNEIQKTAYIMSELIKESLPVRIKHGKMLRVPPEEIYNNLKLIKGVDIELDDINRILQFLKQMDIIGWAQSKEGESLGYIMH